jgi:hypothetical protein
MFFPLIDKTIMPRVEWDFCRELVAKSRWIFAKTLPQNPRYYVLPQESALAAWFVQFLPMGL